MVKILKIAYGRSWTLRRMSWIKNSKEVGLYISKTGGWMFMHEIAG